MFQMEDCNSIYNLPSSMCANGVSGDAIVAIVPIMYDGVDGLLSSKLWMTTTR